MNNGDKSYRISVYIGLANLIILILRGILGYILIGRYEVKKNVVQTEESQASKELMNINKELQKLDLSVKEYRDGLDVQGREIQNKLNKLELDIRVVKNNLEITGKKLGLSSDIMLLANDVIPKASLEYDASRSAPINEQKRGGNKIVHNLSNVGKYPIQVTRCVIFVTKVPLSEDDQAKEKLIEGKDYTLEEEFSFIGFLAAGLSKPYVAMILYTEGLPTKYKSIYLTYLVYYKTHQPIVDQMKSHAKGLLSDEEISSLSSGRTRSQVKLNFAP